jgi:hypothetical protein
MHNGRVGNMRDDNKKLLDYKNRAFRIEILVQDLLHALGLGYPKLYLAFVRAMFKLSVS